jgi:hypothetical protein
MTDPGYYNTGYTMANDPDNSLVCWSGGDYYATSVYVMGASKTTDNGASWIRYQLGAASGVTRAIVVNKQNSNIVYAGGYENSAPKIYRTTNGGTSWSSHSTSGISGNIYSMAIDPTNGNILYAGTTSNVYKTTNGGTNWSSTGMSGGQTNAVLIDPDDHTIIYVGTNSNGVYKSTNSGSTWTQMNDGLNSQSINCLGINPGVYLFAGSNGGSMSRWSLCVGVGEEKEHNVSSGDMLYALPNPAAQRTTICYSLDKTGKVDCAIYDIQGRLIKILMSSAQSAGAHSVLWDGRDEQERPVGAGVYFCRLVTAEQVSVEKLVLTE